MGRTYKDEQSSSHVDHLSMHKRLHDLVAILRVCSCPYSHEECVNLYCRFLRDAECLSFMCPNGRLCQNLTWAILDKCLYRSSLFD